MNKEAAMAANRKLIADTTAALEQAKARLKDLEDSEFIDTAERFTKKAADVNHYAAWFIHVGKQVHYFPTQSAAAAETTDGPPQQCVITNLDALRFAKAGTLHP
jgi:hypothetical protein